MNWRCWLGFHVDTYTIGIDRTYYYETCARCGRQHFYRI